MKREGHDERVKGKMFYEVELEKEIEMDVVQRVTLISNCAVTASLSELQISHTDSSSVVRGRGRVQAGRGVWVCRCALTFSGHSSLPLNQSKNNTN